MKKLMLFAVFALSAFNVKKVQAISLKKAGLGICTLGAACATAAIPFVAIQTIRKNVWNLEPSFLNNFIDIYKYERKTNQNMALMVVTVSALGILAGLSLTDYFYDQYKEQPE